MFPMCHKPFQYHRSRGAALPVAIFIIVVMALLGAAMVRVIGDATQGVVSDVIGARANNAARSGAEMFLVALFENEGVVTTGLCANRSTTSTFDPSDNDSSPNTYNFAEAGLQSCTATVYCDVAEITSPVVVNHYRIVAQGSCDAGDMIYSREIMLEASNASL